MGQCSEVRTHHEAQVVKSIQQQFALVLWEAHVLQPLSHRLLQQPVCSTCRQGKALQQGETFQSVALALWGRDVALPHHPQPAEPSAAATGRRRGQCPGWTGHRLPRRSGRRTTDPWNGLRWKWFWTGAGGGRRLAVYSLIWTEHVTSINITVRGIKTFTCLRSTMTDPEKVSGSKRSQRWHQQLFKSSETWTWNQQEVSSQTGLIPGVQIRHIQQKNPQEGHVLSKTSWANSTKQELKKVKHENKHNCCSDSRQLLRRHKKPFLKCRRFNSKSRARVGGLNYTFYRRVSFICF